VICRVAKKTAARQNAVGPPLYTIRVPAARWGAAGTARQGLFLIGGCQHLVTRAVYTNGIGKSRRN
jgi:hypothetical protein